MTAPTPEYVASLQRAFIKAASEWADNVMPGRRPDAGLLIMKYRFAHRAVALNGEIPQARA